MRRVLVLICFFLSLLGQALSQTDCQKTFYSVFGSVIEDERGYSLASSLDHKSLYVGGIKGDSAVILQISLSGEIDWVRTFDIIPGKEEHIFKLLVDAEGMIGVSGIVGTPLSGGTIFAFRYNPFSKQMLWSVELISTSNNYNQGMIEKGPGGNYLVSSNPQSPNVAELVELDKNTGQVVSSFSKHYDLGSSETMYDLVYLNGSIYSAARFSDGGSTADMRNTLLKLDADNGTVDWMKLGHKTASQSARLYGIDLAIAENDIFSIYLGDDNGTNLNSGTKVFIQRTDLDGNLKWIKHYELPGNNDWVDEIISTENGLVILARNRVAPSDLILFKIDFSGQLVWARKYDYSNNDNSISLGSLQSQLIQVGEYYFFTAFSEESSDADLVIVRTDLAGEIGDSCAFSESIVIPVTTVTNPSFYARNAIVYDYVPQINFLTQTDGIPSLIQTEYSCSSDVSFNENISVLICSGDDYEGYNQDGFYTDTFTTQNGCDSIRILELTVTDVIETTVEVSGCPIPITDGYSEPGIFIDTFTTGTGCDSIRTLYLFETAKYDTISGTICPGKDFEGYTSSGTFTDTLVSFFGCDSIRTVFLNTGYGAETLIEGSICELAFEGKNQPGTYIDTFLTTTGCDSIRTLHLYGIEVYIPNVFSPNNDGINDLFEISIFPYEQTESLSFIIFDRFGSMVYKTENWPVQWDGKSKDDIFYNPGVFTYVLTYLCNGKEILEKGNITLLR